MATGINIGYSCLQLWVKAVDGEDCFKPDYSILDNYIKSLQTIENKESIYYYLTALKEELLALKAQIKSHKNKYDNLLFKIDSSNVLECIS